MYGLLNFRAMLCVFLLLVILGTFCDLCNVSAKSSKHILVRILNCFSAYSNGKKLLSTTKVEGSIDCIHGLRLFSMCWVVLGHTWFTLMQTPTDNFFDLADVSFHLSLIIIKNK